MKILYVATIGGFMPFFKSFIRQLLDEGNSVDIATNMSQFPIPEYYEKWGCRLFQISCSRSPLNKGNVSAIKEIREIVKSGEYDIVHCHTPIAAACTRIACRKARKKGTTVIYTAHGFHFYNGAPLKNWLIFYPVEKICSRWTDALITINKEDYERSRKSFKKLKNIFYVPGVGLDTSVFTDNHTDKKEKRKEFCVPDEAIVLLSVGELNTNKNHQSVIHAIAEIGKKHLHYVVAGKGDQKENLEKLADELNIQEQLHLIGYRNDVPSLYRMADMYILPSIREGLNVSLMEAMASGLPCLAGKIRGNIDLVDNEGGLLFSPSQNEDIKETIQKALMKTHEEWKKMGEHNAKKIEMFSKEEVNREMEEIYKRTARLR